MSYRSGKAAKLPPERRDKLESLPNTALTAVALQDHWARSLSLKDPVKKKINHSLPVAAKPRSTAARIKGGKGPETRESNKEYVLDPVPPPPTLAQKYGLVEAPEKLLSDTDWQSVKQQSNARLDSTLPCVICKEDFGNLQQVLLSCSHVFHRTCLEAFEKFSGKKCCPMCRKEKYQKRIIHEGAKQHRVKCVIRIQAAWRGYVLRSWYRKLRQTVAPKDPKLRQKFYENKLQSITDRLVGSMEASRATVDNLMSEINQSLASSRNIMSRIDGDCIKSPISSQEWEQARLKAVERCTTDCPICIMPLAQQGLYNRETSACAGKHRPSVLLSCSHVFHMTCLQAFEEFTTSTKHVCPVCRATYQKRVL
ncbi:RING finger protein 32 [Nematostella vectensis]|uniref:RING finger protein 32 n=1 Tax=Nematostella vectensis TaxID=45351 RepID=UPI0020770074|nr:RING finger protein 32 [Nematostella vectensis]